MKTLTLRAPVSRQLPDPVFGPTAKRWVLFCKAVDLPTDIPTAPNPRQSQNINRMVYRDVAASLRNQLGEQDTFHLKNKGITLFASEVVQKGAEHHVRFDDGQGILDGGHTYAIITAALSDEESPLPASQYVKLEIVTGIDAAITDEIAAGLNTSVQVETKTLANHKGQFDWIKETLVGKEYASDIAYIENESNHYEIREIIAFLTLFNIDVYRNDTDVQNYPISAYTGKELTLDRYLADEEGVGDQAAARTYRKLQPIVCDILQLQERISFETGPLHNQLNRGRAGQLSFIDYSKSKPHEFPVLGLQGDKRLHKGALYPTLGAFRYLVVQDPTTGLYRWRTENGFAGVLTLWEQTAGELVRILHDSSVDLRRNINAMGKNRLLWSSLYSHLKSKALEIDKVFA